MKNTRPAFDVWEEDILELPPGYKNITCHMIFDFRKGKNFRRKRDFFAYAHKTKTPAATTYSSGVFRDSVPIALK